VEELNVKTYSPINQALIISDSGLYTRKKSIGGNCYSLADFAFFTFTTVFLILSLLCSVLYRAGVSPQAISKSRTKWLSSSTPTISLISLTEKRVVSASPFLTGFRTRPRAVRVMWLKAGRAKDVKTPWQIYGRCSPSLESDGLRALRGSRLKTAV
ncbi:MAG: hypothetical protein M3R15_17660, partial [Acidobacteriota bacterium]|nr:hypothetical protein [Acidobacteriota bacterium]